MMYHRLKMFLLTAHGMAVRKLGGNLYKDPPLIRFEEAGTFFQSPILMDARESGFVELASDGFRVKKEFQDMTRAEFYDAVAGTKLNHRP